MFDTIHLAAADTIDRLGWVQGAEKTSDGVCLTGALKECSPVPGDWLIAREVYRQRGHAESWNDVGGRSKDEVTDYLRSAPILDSDLAVMFGPQWEQIVALVRRAAVLTPEEGGGLAAARSAAWAAAGAAAWDAAWDAARSAARDAARSAAWAAAGAAAWALVIRDLIGQDGFTQAHYDLLSGPWRKVIGPIHPDDTALA